MFKNKKRTKVPPKEEKNSHSKEGPLRRFDKWVQRKTRNIGIKKEKAYFIENMTMLLDSGMDVLTMLEALGEESDSSNMKNLINELQLSVEAGNPFWLAMKNTGVFPSYAIAMMQIGEESGRLKENLKSISLQEKKDSQFYSKIRSAMMYPILVIFLSLFVGLGIAWFILPKLSTVFAQLSLDLPLVTKILIRIGDFLNDYGVIFVPSFLGFIVLFFYFVFLNEKTNRLGKRLLLFFPGIKTLIKEMELSRLGYVLGNLLHSGIDIVDAVASIAKATPFPYYQSFYLKLRDGLGEGVSFREIFEKEKKTDKIFPVSVQKMIIAGAKSSTLADTFLNIGKGYEFKTERTTNNLTVVLEPIMLVIVWMGVVMVALSVILPIYSLVGGFNPGLAGEVNQTENMDESVTPNSTLIPENQSSS